MKNKSKTPGQLKNIVGGLIKKWEKGVVKKGNAVNAAWTRAVGDDTRGHSRPVNLKNGTLIVLVENSTWLYKLTLEKRKILKVFNENYTGRKKAVDIRYRIGAVTEKK